MTRPLRYSINVTLDGCVDHQAVVPGEEVHNHAADNIARADALLFGRVTYQMMEDGWREAAETGVLPEWMDDSWMPFAQTIHTAKKYVASTTLPEVDWNAELIRGDLADAVRQLKEQPGNGLFTGGVQLPLALAELGLIDEYELVVHPTVVGHGPRLFAGLSRRMDLQLVDRIELDPGVVALQFVPRR